MAPSERLTCGSVTATRDRDSDLDTDPAEVEWDEHPIFGKGRGLPWWAAVLLALVLSAAGALLDSSRLVDDQRLNSLGLYQIAFLAGCVLAVLAVRRRNLFGPMVQPPLIFAATFIPIQLTSRTSTETGTKKLIFEVGLPLASSFPWMAGATAATIVLGVIRLLIQRNPDVRAKRLVAEDDDRPRREPAKSRPPRDRDDRPAKGSRDRLAREDRPERAPRDDRRGGDDRAARGERPRRESGQPPRRPAREGGRDERPVRDSGGRPDRGRPDKAERGDRGNRGEDPPRRNPPRPRDQDAKPRGSQQRRRPRED
jgi:hypothetical protein